MPNILTPQNRKKMYVSTNMPPVTIKIKKIVINKNMHPICTGKIEICCKRSAMPQYVENITSALEY